MSKIVNALPLFTSLTGSIMGARSAIKKNQEEAAAITPANTKLKRYAGETDESYKSRVDRSVAAKKRHLKSGNNITSSVVRGALGGYFIGAIGKTLLGKPSSYGQYSKGRRGGSSGYYSRPGGAKKTQEATDLGDALKKAKTKAEAKSAYRDYSKKTHPDKGGDAETFKDINNEWQQFMQSGKFDKLAFLRYMRERGSLDEFEKISSHMKMAVGQKVVFDSMMKRLLGSRIDPKYLKTEFGQNFYKDLIKRTVEIQNRLKGAGSRYKPFDREDVVNAIKAVQSISKSPMKGKLSRVVLPLNFTSYARPTV